MKINFFILIILSFIMTSFAAKATEVRTGEWIQRKNYEYRYVTTYEIEKISRPMSGFPWIEEDCHDEGQRFANWAKSISYEISYGGSVKFSLLGFMEIDLGADRSKTVELTFQRWVVPTKGIRARHRLMEEFQNFEGTTKKEKRYYQDGRVELSKNSRPFKLSKVHYGISVEREVLEICQ